MKTCSNCKTQKPLHDFYKQAAAKDGHSYWCKQCSHKNSMRYKREKRLIRNSYGVAVHGERLREAAKEALSRFSFRLNFTNIEKLQ